MSHLASFSAHQLALGIEGGLTVGPPPMDQSGGPRYSAPHSLTGDQLMPGRPLATISASSARMSRKCRGQTPRDRASASRASSKSDREWSRCLHHIADKRSRRVSSLTERRGTKPLALRGRVHSVFASTLPSFLWRRTTPSTQSRGGPSGAGGHQNTEPRP